VADHAAACWPWPRRSSSRALTWLQRYYLLRLETRLALGTSSRFFNHILRLPAAYFGQRFAGEIGSRVQINDKVAKVISGKLATTVIDSVMTSSTRC
jgi:ABC-type bacteriocin/lantibiotic exporter with double-glycine peptidase domain